MAAMERHIRLAQDLHPRLLRFFTRFPPSLINGATQPSVEPVQIAQNTSSMNPNATTTTTTIEPPSSDVPQYPRNRNPFLAFKNPNTGNWHAPHYSLRRQAELFKLAKEFDVLPLMPHSPKHPEIKEQKRIENGLRVQGTGIGKRVKGKLWERTLKGRLAERTKAMEGMPEMIRQWKERGHGRGWKKWPK
jgi:large subunit ribosomal protein L25